jgi:DNA-binding CsgD family transcriptional regulator
VDRITDRLVNEVLAGPVEPPTRHLLTTAAGEDPALLRALVLAGLALGDLVRHNGRWRWEPSATREGRLANLVENRATRLGEPQLAALRTLTGPWTRPYTVATRTLRDRSTAEEPTEAAAARQRLAVALTGREQEVLVLLSDGLTSRAIARRLSLSPRTVAKHQERVYRKFGTSDRLTTVLRAQRLGLLHPPAEGTTRSAA